jgi:hypothetical protein
MSMWYPSQFMVRLGFIKTRLQLHVDKQQLTNEELCTLPFDYLEILFPTHNFLARAFLYPNTANDSNHNIPHVHCSARCPLNFTAPNLLPEYGCGTRQFVLCYDGTMNHWLAVLKTEQANRLSQPELKFNTRQAMYIQRNIDGHSSNHCCSGKAIGTTYSECVPVALGNQHTTYMRCIILSHVASLALQYSSALSNKRREFC